jgi:molybdopterin-containing oxidoreductase family membrane subunit
MADDKRLLAVYAYIDDVLEALSRLKAENASVETVYSPALNDQLKEILEVKPSPVRFFVLFGGIFGAIFGFFVASYGATRWNLLVWGKPPVSVLPYVIISFEFCILMAILFGLSGYLILSRMPRYKTPGHFDARFTEDRFGILLTCPAGQRDRIAGLLRETGAEEVSDARL